LPRLRVVEKPASSAIAKLVEDYLTNCRARGLSYKTIDDAYGRPLKHVFLPFCAREGITEPAQVTSRILDRLGAELREKGGARGELSPHSIHAYLRPVNSLLTWAEQEGELGAGLKAATPKLPKKQLVVLEREEIQAMEDAAKTERDKLIIRVLGDTGVRLDELLTMRTGSLLEQPGVMGRYYLRVKGKGSKERDVPIMPALFRRLQRYIAKGRPSGADIDRLWIAHRRSRNGSLEPLASSGVQQMIRLTAKEAGIKKRTHPHLLRHSYATWALRQGMNPIQLADILGHNSLTMIQEVYAHLTPVDAYDAQARIFEDELRDK
jgi:integrase/recombinase XerD